MAKKDKDTIFKEYLAELEAINPAIKDILADDKVSAKLKDGVLARADYSASMDSLKNEREAFAAEITEARTKIKGWQDWYGQTSTEVANVQNELKAYKEAYGDLEPGDQRRIAREAGLTPEEFEKRLNAKINEHDVYSLKIVDDLTDIKIDFRDRFKEKLDTQAVYKIAGERGVDLNTAYNLHIADRVEDQRKAQWDTELKKAREDAVQEYASKHNLPVVPTNSDLVHVLDTKDAPRTSNERVAAAIAGMNASRR